MWLNTMSTGMHLVRAFAVWCPRRRESGSVIELTDSYGTYNVRSCSVGLPRAIYIYMSSYTCLCVYGANTLPIVWRTHWRPPNYLPVMHQRLIEFNQRTVCQPSESSGTLPVRPTNARVWNRIAHAHTSAPGKLRVSRSNAKNVCSAWINTYVDVDEYFGDSIEIFVQTK